MIARNDVQGPEAEARAGAAAGGAAPVQPPVQGAEAARARAYLDLWERQLVHAALHLRAPAGARVGGRSTAR